MSSSSEGDVSLQEAGQIEDELFRGKEGYRPALFITFGPPASGKDQILRQLLKQEKIVVNGGEEKERKTLVRLLVDEIVSKFQGYQEEMREVMSDIVSPEEEENPDLLAALTRRVQEIYWRWRPAADRISESALTRALLERLNVVFETTGQSIAWTNRVIDRARRQNYRTVLVYPLVEPEQLVLRAELRARREGRRIDPQRILNNVSAAADNFVELAGRVDEAFVYDNSGTPEELDLLLELVNEWRGWCTTQDTHCQNGQVTRARCSPRASTQLTKLLPTQRSRDFARELCVSSD